MNKPFPTVEPEPTSHLPQIADNDEYPTYKFCECHMCGSKAIKKHAKGGMKFTICRECETGSDLLYAKSNYGDDWNEVRQWVLERDGGKCRECGSNESLEVHHIKKLVWFETIDKAHTPENLITLCKQCHNKLEDKPDHFQKI